MAIDWAGINWKKGFNRLWLFISVVIGVIMFIYAYNSISPEEAPPRRYRVFCDSVHWGTCHISGFPLDYQRVSRQRVNVGPIYGGTHETPVLCDCL